MTIYGISKCYNVTETEARTGYGLASKSQGFTRSIYSVPVSVAADVWSKGYAVHGPDIITFIFQFPRNTKSVLAKLDVQLIRE